MLWPGLTLSPKSPSLKPETLNPDGFTNLGNTSAYKLTIVASSIWGLGLEFRDIYIYTYIYMCRGFGFSFLLLLCALWRTHEEYYVDIRVHTC